MCKDGSCGFSPQDMEKLSDKTYGDVFEKMFNMLNETLASEGGTGKGKVIGQTDAAVSALVLHLGVAGKLTPDQVILTMNHVTRRAVNTIIEMKREQMREDGEEVPDESTSHAVLNERFAALAEALKAALASDKDHGTIVVEV